MTTRHLIPYAIAVFLAVACAESDEDAPPPPPVDANGSTDATADAAPDAGVDTGPEPLTGGVEVPQLHGKDFLMSTGQFAGGAKTLVNATITGATADTGGKVTVTFAVVDGAQSPVIGIPSVSANIVKLVPPSGDESFSKWVAYIYRVQTVTGSDKGDWPAPDGTAASQADRESSGVLTDHGDGTYTYEYSVNLTQATRDGVAISYDRNLTHRVSIMMGGRSGATADAAFDFVPDGGPVTTTREIVTTATCKSCHGDEFHGHGGDRLSVENCATCHLPGNIDPHGGESLDLKVMIHKIHAGGELATVPGPDGAVWNNPATPVDETADNGTYAIWGFNNTRFTWWKVGFPAVIANCAACHRAGAAQADNWKTVPSRAACGSCHDDVDFATGAGHEAGAQTSDVACASCHPASGTPSAVVESHDWTARDPRNIPEFTLDLSVSGPANGTHFVPGESPNVSLVIREDGVPIDHTTVVEDDEAEGCLPGGACPPRDGKFRNAHLFVSGPRADRRPVLTTAARAVVRSADAGPFDLSATGASLILKVDGGLDVFSVDRSGGDVRHPGTITVAVPATGAFADRAAATAVEVVAWLNAHPAFRARAIAFLDDGRVAIRSRNLGTFFAVQLMESDVTDQVFGSDLTVHASTGFTPSNILSKRIVDANDDPKAVRTVDRITYQLDPVDDLQPGTYVVYAEVADRGRVNGTDYRTPSVAKSTFQVGTPTEELPIARNCNACHQSPDGKGFVLDYPRHNKIFDDLAVDRCGSCHDYVPQTDVGDFAGAKAIARRVHAVHFGARLNYPNTTVAYVDPIAGRNWDITFPQDVRNCEACHVEGTTSGTWKTRPHRLACGGCHDADAAQAHLKVMTFDPTPTKPFSGDEVESCAECHAASE